MPPGLSTTRSPSATAPDSTVPVTTVPGADEDEAAVDRETETPGAIANGMTLGLGFQPRLQGVETFTRDGRDGQKGGFGEPGAQERGPDVSLERRAATDIREIGLAQSHDAMPDPEQIRDGEMFARLRHHAIVGRPPPGSRQSIPVAPATMVPNETFVPGHVDEAARAARAGLPVGETEVDRDAAPLFLGQPVGLDAGQGADESGLSMIDVTGRADDHAGTSCGR